MIELYGAEWATTEEVVAQLGKDVTPAMLDQWHRRGLARRIRAYIADAGK